ncbi:MAG: hypothetical protein QM820_16970 [Minicystis sp.]
MVLRLSSGVRALSPLALLAGSIAACVASCATGTGLGETTSSASSSESASSSVSSASSAGSGGAASSSTAGSGGASSSGGMGGGGMGGSGTGGSAGDAGSDAGDAGSDAGDGGADAGDAGDDAGDGGTTSGVVVMLAGSGTQILAGEFHPGAGWTTTTLTGATNDGLAVTLTGPTAGIGVIRSTANGGEVRFTSWSPGAWTALAALGAGVTTRATPALTASGAAASLVFHGDDFKHYFAAHSTSWAPVAEQVGGSAAQSFGPSPASIATLGTDAVITFAGNNNDLYDQTRSGGTWQAAHGHALGATVTLTPAIVALTSGPDLLIAFVRSSDARIVYTTRAANVWSAPAPIDTNALSNDPVSIAALPGGEAVLAYRGQNGKTYWSRYKPTATPAWTPPTGISATNFDTPSTPAVAPGIGGVDAEMVFIDGATGAAKHARLTGTTWSSPLTIGGSGLTRAGVASNPN